MVTRVIVSKPVVRQDILTKGMVDKKHKETDSKGGGSARAYQNMSPVTCCLLLGYTNKSLKGLPKECHQLRTKFATHTLIYILCFIFNSCMFYIQNIISGKLPLVLNISLGTTHLSFAI